MGRAGELEHVGCGLRGGVMGGARTSEPRQHKGCPVSHSEPELRPLHQLLHELLGNSFESK